MKIYCGSGHIFNINPQIFHEQVGPRIKQCQNTGYEVEIQYQTCTSNGLALFSALILSYTEE